MKTSQQIEGDFLALIEGSSLAQAVTGEVYRGATRPRGSKAEDITIDWLAGTTGDIQRGIVLVKVYVADICPYQDGIYVGDSARLEQLERIADDWVDTLRGSVTNYKIRREDTIYCVQEQETHEHAVIIRLGYLFYGSNND